MNDKQQKTISKFLSLVLRHSPETIGLRLDENGWADVATLLQKLNEHGHAVTREQLEIVVADNDKQRFAFNGDRTGIRASQGHSIGIRLDLTPQQPPEVLYHGTTEKFLQSIQEGGLQKMSRQHVHLSRDRETAHKVGSRHGSPAILTIRSGQMYDNGILFYLSDNGVWLTDNVPVQYIDF